jgi:hypothetical protein
VRHPLAVIPVGARWRLFAPLLVLTLLAMGVLGWVDRRITNPDVPSGIVSFELAGNAEAARSMVGSWTGTAPLWVAFSNGFDYLFMLLYSTTIALGCIWAAGRYGARASGLAHFGAPLAWGQWLAGGLDAIENVALTRMLVAGVADPWPALAWWAAAPKFFLVGIGLAYVLGGVFARPRTSLGATVARAATR